MDASYTMFLQLLCTQLQTQNPLDPVDATDFTQQLATYAGLEQQISTNDKLDSLITSLNSMSMSNGTGYLGHTVDVDTDTLSVSDDGTVDASWVYSVGSAASNVTLSILDESGNAIWSTTGTAGSSQTLKWDGTNSSGKAVGAGDYTLQITATDSSGNAVTSSVAIRGTVTAVSSSDDSTILELGDTQVDIDDVTRLAV